ncbi:lytic transglycosylase domain-containing protein [Nocardioides sp. WS12]|uniref:aggregation-promoting factor C-terminal-like domain-containing protein n=1 Tax=Nocardioides sp. WS12 TaxID=2486272 RepID=UPI0015FA6BCF|nr:lytic transglycosylase domain-containing protein [Nocardioides sp. WS12]
MKQWSRRARATAPVAVATIAVLGAGCAATPAEPEATASPSVASTTPAAPASTSAVPAPSAPSATPARLSGARADVPLIEIMAQLARRAERIAKNLPKVVIPTDVDRGSNRALGYQLMIEFGFPADQWPYLDALWHRESGWNQFADNPTSSAYGIPQSLPGSKMAVVGADWQTNPETQIRWGLAYIAARYGNAQRAWAHSEQVGWY